MKLISPNNFRSLEGRVTLTAATKLSEFTVPEIQNKTTQQRVIISRVTCKPRPKRYVVTGKRELVGFGTRMRVNSKTSK